MTQKGSKVGPPFGTPFGVPSLEPFWVPFGALFGFREPCPVEFLLALLGPFAVNRALFPSWVNRVA